VNTEVSVPYLISRRTLETFPYLTSAAFSTLLTAVPPISIVLGRPPFGFPIKLPFPSVSPAVVVTPVTSVPTPSLYGLEGLVTF
jgi:hypothetical protein